MRETCGPKGVLHPARWCGDVCLLSKRFYFLFFLKKKKRKIASKLPCAHFRPVPNLAAQAGAEHSAEAERERGEGGTFFNIHHHHHRRDRQPTEAALVYLSVSRLFRCGAVKAGRSATRRCLGGGKEKAFECCHRADARLITARAAPRLVGVSLGSRRAQQAPGHQGVRGAFDPLGNVPDPCQDPNWGGGTKRENRGCCRQTLGRWGVLEGAVGCGGDACWRWGGLPLPSSTFSSRICYTSPRGLQKSPPQMGSPPERYGAQSHY